MMEQYSVDVNKVLSEFDFNEARGDQAPSLAVSGNAAPLQVGGLPLQYGMSNAFCQVPMQGVNSDDGIAGILEGIDINSKEINLLEEQECLASNISNPVSSDQNILIDNLDSINHFYTHNRLHNDELQQNLCIDVNEAASSSSLLNVVKPSVGNIFNNFNEFVHDTNTNLVNFAIPSKTSTMEDSRQNEALIDVADPFVNNFPKASVEVVKKCSIDDLLTVQTEDLLENKKGNSSVPPSYQNILLPIKIDPYSTDKFKESQANKLEQDLDFPDLMTAGNKITSAFSNPEQMVKSILDEPEHVYENVYIGTDIPKAQEACSAVDEARKIGSVFKHTYENVNFPNSDTQFNDSGAYEQLYINNSVERTETSSDSTDHFNLKEPQFISLGASTTLGFQNIQLGNSQIPKQDTKSVVGFTTIDDMSEEELNKYLADLEAEERASEQVAALYENVQIDAVAESNVKPKSLPVQRDDEDANEAPIFESVTIGKLPQVPQEHLQEKVKKFPVIDYSKESGNEETCSESAHNLHDVSKFNAQIRDNENKIKSKLIHEKVRKSSDNTEPTQTLNPINQDDENKNEDLVEDWDDGNYVSTTNETESGPNKLDAQSLDLNLEEKIDLNSAKALTSKLENVDNKNLETKEQNIAKPLNHKKSATHSGTPVRSTETISRFSVTRNVDVNDKIGSRSRPSQKCSGNNMTCDESSASDPHRPPRPQTLNVVSTINVSDNSTAGALHNNQETSDAEGDKDSGRAPSPDVSDSSSMESGSMLGKQPPFWVPDGDAPNCMLCNTKFTVYKRRHHCRACGKVLCHKCCNMRYRLEYQSNVDSRVCIPCHQLLTKAESDTGSSDYAGCLNTNISTINSPQARPNPNNPMEYCSTIPPLQQLAGGLPPPPPTVMVPVGVLKREGATKQRSEGPKSVMFSDELDTTWDWKPPSTRKAVPRRPVQGYVASAASKKQNRPPLDPVTDSYIPQDSAALPPTVIIHKGQVTYHEITDVDGLYNSLKNECEPPVMFAINRNLYAYVKIINLNCCANRTCWNVTSKGLACVAQDEVIFLVETMPDEKEFPKDLLLHINQIYHEATKGNTISEYGMSIHQSGNLLGSREHAGFLFIRQTLQCLQKVIVPPAPFLVGLLVHRWETPWAKVFPLRLVLRLGAEYRYYPCPLISVRFRDAVYFEIGHTIMKVLADFRNYAYTLPKVQGLTIHMQDRTTQVRFPKNRFNQVIKGLNNSNDHVLAFASNFSIEADSHLVCMQTNLEDESTYQTQAINIQNKPRKVTGASFIVINGALKSSMGLSANSNILEDGLMVQIMPEKMEALKAALKNMQDFTIGCGRQGAPEPDEIVNITWVENDMQFNLGVKSPIDSKPMDGIPSIRVHNGINFAGTSRFIRWTEVFIIKSDDDQPFGMHYPVDINKLSESIARATCAALVKLLDLLAAAGLTKIAVRTTIHPDNVGYEAGSEGTRLPPIYMKSLDNELIQVLQKAVQGCEDTHTVLELVFYVLETDV
ncbi:zinc finger FYVE domain-containing protein 9 isoform X2 [Copidosoma floridanum]|uniref:zinc finger FYVE domain-containing protein 9 isoform X2 n=1 Tax=Copidosoma floridanum TaxID=29053 RepID=UPI0006C96C62|nr:zinc finger FYVE domain-containing protein 9 isoform X2 [Copidosoma floridanum]